MKLKLQPKPMHAGTKKQNTFSCFFSLFSLLFSQLNATATTTAMVCLLLFRKKVKIYRFHFVVDIDNHSYYGLVIVRKKCIILITLVVHRSHRRSSPIELYGTDGVWSMEFGWSVPVPVYVACVCENRRIILVITRR